MAEITQRIIREIPLYSRYALPKLPIAGRIEPSERNARAREGVHMCEADFGFTPYRNESRSK